MVSFTGEKLYEVQVIAAVDRALAGLRGRYHFIAAVAELVDGTSPRLIFLTEFDEPISGDGSALVDRVDTALGEENDEYLTKRRSLRYSACSSTTVRSWLPGRSSGSVPGPSAVASNPFLVSLDLASAIRPMSSSSSSRV